MTNWRLLLDLHLPGTNGFDVLEALRSRQKPGRVIVVTAHDEPGKAERVRALGAFDDLEKPVEQAVLISAIEAAMTPLDADEEGRSFVADG